MTIKKMKVKIPASRPRNPFHDEVKGLRAGAHGPTPKAKRQKQRQNMQRDLAALVKGDKAEFEID